MSELIEHHAAKGLMGPGVETTAVTLEPYALAVSPEQVARYAGGTRYRVHASQAEDIGIILNRAHQLVEPAFVYRTYEVGGHLEGGHLKLSNGRGFPVPPGEQDSGIESLAFCVCTLGPKLEESVGALMSEGDPLAGLFLDAAGVTFLEALSARAYETMQELARESHLQAGCRFGPGYGEIDLSYQGMLFDLVDASLIGVRLNESCVMSPAKSLSFVTAWTSSPIPLRSRNKCASCTLPHCPYRV